MDLPDERHTQLGCFTSEQALAIGWTKWTLDAACRRQRLVRLRPGVFVDADSLARRDRRARHLTLIVAEQLALGQQWCAARRSAAVVYELPLIGDIPDRPQLAAPGTRRGRRPRDRHNRLGPLPLSDQSEYQGIPVVTIARTVADIARAERFRNAVVVADAALRAGTTRADLEACLKSMRRWPGVARARQAVAFADGRSESPLESISRADFHELQLPPPEPQVEVWLGDRFIGRVDFLWRETNTIGEADGVKKFGETDEQRARAFGASKQRQEWLEDVGFEVARWGWPEAWRPEGALDARLGRAFRRGGNTTVDPDVRLISTSLPLTTRRAA